ncbi:Os02g0103850, partial [Oryza sativa Japonica Group]
SVDFHIPLLRLLQLLLVVKPYSTVFCSEVDHDVVDAFLHALEAAHVDVGVVLLEQLPQLVLVLRHPRLDVHLLPRRVRLLPAHREVQPEPLRRDLLHPLELLPVQQRAAGGHPEEEPRQAVELVVVVLLEEHLPQEGPEGRDAGAGAQHDDGGVGVLGHQHLLPHWPRDLHVRTRLQLTEEVGADSFDDLSLIVGVHQPLHAQRYRLGVGEVPDGAAGDGVEAELVGLAVLVDAVGDDADGLPLAVGDLAVGAEHHVPRLTGGVVAGDPRVQEAPPRVRLLGPVLVRHHAIHLLLRHLLHLSSHLRSRRCGRLRRRRLRPHAITAASLGPATRRVEYGAGRRPRSSPGYGGASFATGQRRHCVHGGH